MSHSTYHVQKLCRHAIWLKDGRIEAQGDAFDVTQRYQAWLEQRESSEREAGAAARGDYRIETMDVATDGLESPAGGRIRIALRASSRHGERPHLLVGLSRLDGTAIFGTGTEIDGVQAWPLGPGACSAPN